ncbi:MAG TPA: glycosyltransferase family 2 protein [Dehalococcoidia bacterium]|nr:glycosyltransferase family 2 protein [Dehalococcoidia bacterium]
MIESPARTIGTAVPDRKGQPRLIAVMPAFNEASTIVGVLDHLYPMVDRLLIVDDGSVDNTREAVFEWLADKPHAHLISFNKNRGMSAAYYEAFLHLGRMAATGKIGKDDVVLTVDADGQHDPASIDLLLRPIAEGADAVIARRDFRLYPLYKRLGNWIMSAWASIWGGRRFRDVESGFRAFRVGALLDALQYYKGYKYSETVEIAVILPRLGYTVHDSTLVDIPVFRSRTRLKDVIIDLVAMPCAWWRVVAARRLPAGVPTWFAYWVLPLFFLAAAGVLLRMLTRAIYLGDDTINNYVHVWYISDRIFHAGQIPLHIAGLDGGRAFAFPYGLTPWLVNALVFPLLGNWSVTLFLVLGGLAATAAALVVRPDMRDPWLLVPFLANPFLIDALGSGQDAFLWSAAGFFIFVWSVERRRWPVSAAALWFTASTHPIEGGMAVAAYLIWHAIRHREDLVPLAAVSALALPFLLPSIYFALATPALHETGTGTLTFSVLQDLPRRGSVLAAPFLLTWGAPFLRRHYRPLGAAFTLAAVPTILLSAGALAGMPVVGYLSGQGSYAGLVSPASDFYSGYLASGDFRPGLVYRVLSPNQKEQGAYYLIRHGGVLANELFSESQARHSWSERGYQCYLAAKHVDRVVVERGYHHQFRTNEQLILNALVTRGLATLTYGGAGDHIAVYDVVPFRSAIATLSSVTECNGL